MGGGRCRFLCLGGMGRVLSFFPFFLGLVWVHECEGFDQSILSRSSLVIGFRGGQRRCLRGIDRRSGYGTGR